MQRRIVTLAVIEKCAKRVALADGITEAEAIQKLIRAYGHENIDFSDSTKTAVTGNDLNFVGGAGKLDFEKTRVQPFARPRLKQPLQP